MTHNYQEFVSS